MIDIKVFVLLNAETLPYRENWYILVEYTALGLLRVSYAVRLVRRGRLAHLARALRWQRRGDRFESDILHP